MNLLDHPLFWGFNPSSQPFWSESPPIREQTQLHSNISELGLRNRSYIPSDGNCQFAALACQLFGRPELAHKLRCSVANFLRGAAGLELANGSKLKDFVLETSFDQYVDKMAQQGCWGDQITLQCVATLFATPIAVISSASKQITLIRGFDTDSSQNTIITPAELRDLVLQTISSEGEHRIAIVSHLHELHYSSLEPDSNFFDF
jgi:hypothetical protein